MSEQEAPKATSPNEGQSASTDVLAASRNVVMCYDKFQFWKKHHSDLTQLQSMHGRISQTVHSHEIGENALRSLHMLNASLDKLRDVLAAANV